MLFLPHLYYGSINGDLEAETKSLIVEEIMYLNKY